MTTTAAPSSLNLPLLDLEKSQPLVAATADILLYPEVSVAFLDGEPFHTDDILSTYLTLVRACTAVHTRTPQQCSWDTPLGVIEVEPRSFNIVINGVEHAPETVDTYSQELQEILKYTNTPR